MNIFFPLLFFFGPFGIFIYYQIKICKNPKNKKLALILPIGSSLISILSLISIFLSLIFGIINSFIDKSNNSNMASYVLTLESSLIPGILVQLLNTIVLILILFIPPIIFTLIYLHYSKLHNWKK